MPNQYANVHRLSSDPISAVTEASMLVNEALGGQKADLIFAFCAGYAGAEFDLAMPKISDLTGCENVVGVSCVSLISGTQEFENQSGICLWAARFEDAKVLPFHLEFNTHAGEQFFAGWPDQSEAMWAQDPALFFLTEPFSFPIDALLVRIGEDHPNIRAFGGVADGASRPGEARLLLGKETFTEGGIAVMVSGVAVESVVSQGCRPIGKPYIVTSAERNQIRSLGGRPAFDVLKSMYDKLPTQDKAQVEQGLHLGIAMTELKDNFEYGDFLIRNVIGIDEEEKCFSLSDYVRMGRTVQFHIRDALSASAELESMLQKTKAQMTEAGAASRAALVFSCNGRGCRLFPEPHHDAETINKVLGKLECAGFFAAGEIGSVGDQAFLHGFTASVAIFE